MRERTCPFCGAKCVHPARVWLGRVARAALLGAGAGAVADCGSAHLMYGGPCLADPDACVASSPDGSARADVAQPGFADGSGEEDASDAAADVFDDSPSD